MTLDVRREWWTFCGCLALVVVVVLSGVAWDLSR
jgi:hypothetical protein